MGDIADAMLDGDLCQCCGEYMEGGATPLHPFVYLYIDGVSYKSLSGNGYALDNLLMQDAGGNIAYLSGTFTSYLACHRTGRGQSCVTHWSFVGGTVVR